MLRSTTGETMTLEGVDAKGRVRGLLFELAVEQRYRNPKEANVEAIYTFPLPSDAVLLDLEVELNGRKLVAAVVERKAAERDYEQAIDKGDTAIMLERAGDGLCTLNLGNLMAGESAKIRYRYAQLLSFEHGSVRLTIPTVIAPRYGNPKAAGLRPHQVPTSDLAVAYPFSLSIDLEGEIAGGTLASPSHALAIAATATGMHVGLARGAFLDRDFVLAVTGLSGKSLAVVARDGAKFVALASFCADAPREATDRPLTLKLLVDCSGSMTGDSIAAAKRALHRILASLESGDRFSYSRFGSRVVHETDGLVRASDGNVRAGAEQVGRTNADLGGTEMEAGLRQVFAIGGRDGAADVLLLTDGETWNADHLIAEARGARQRVFVVAIGSAPAEGLLSRLAEATGGACEFVAPNEDAEAAILRTFSRLRAPRVERAEVAWPATPAWTTPLPQGLFGGETIHAFAGFDVEPTGAIALALHAKAEARPLTAAVQFDGTVAEDRTLSRIAAARRIESVGEDEKLRLALGYGLLTARTNLLVVHERAEGERAVDLPQLAHVAQMHAAGWHGVGSVREVRARAAFLDAPPVADEHAYRDIAFDRLEAPVRRKAAARRIDSNDGYEAARLAAPRAPDDDASAIGESKAKVEDTPPVFVPVTPIATVLAALEAAGMNALPSTFEDLDRLGVPKDVQSMLYVASTMLVDSHEIVQAFLEALALWDAEMNHPPILSPHIARAMRRAFTFPWSRRAVRGQARFAVEHWHRFACMPPYLPASTKKPLGQAVTR